MSLKTWLAVLLLGSVTLSPASGQTQPAGKAASAPQDFAKQAYVIERISSRFTAEGDGTGTREVTAEVKILADAGVKSFAVLNFTYTSANETVDIDYVRVRKPDGTVVKTPDYNIQDMPGEVTRTAPLYSDIHEKHVAVKGLSVGDTLEYSLRYRVTKPEVPGHFWYEYSFNKQAIVKDERLELNVPRDKYVKVVSPEYKPDVKEDGLRRIYTWSHSNLIVKERDPEEIPRRVPPNPDVQITTFASWEDVGRWYGSLQKEPLTVTPAIQKKADDLTKGLKTDDEKIHAIYNFVSLKFHYIGLDFGIGRYQPHAADDVLDNGYGDCKDKHTLLASLLKAAGIEAWPALIHSTRKLDPDVPSPAQFNHVITVVPLNGSYIWLDTTPEVARYRFLLLGLRNKQALTVPIDQPPRLITTPENPLEPQRQEFSMSGKLDSEGTFTGHAEQVFEGDVEVMMRAAFRQVPESQWKELLQRFSRGLNFGGEVSNVKVTPPDDIDKPLEFSYDYVRKEFGGWKYRQITAPLPPIGVESYRGITVKKPVEPYPLGSLGKVIYHSRVELPEGYTVTPFPAVRLAEPYAEYDSRTVFDEGVMTTNRTLNIKKTEVPVSDWDGFRKFGEAVYDDEFNYMNLESTGTAAGNKGTGKGVTKEPIDIVRPEEKLEGAALDEIFNNGVSAFKAADFQKAQELFEKVIANNPNYKGVHFNLALTLVALRRDMEGAVEQLRKEEKIDPGNTRVYQMVASYMAATGKPKEAIEEWQKLLKVDPENRTAASTLAGLLYQEERYPEAVTVLEEALKKAPDSSGLKLQLGAAYLKAGQNDKAVAAFEQVIDEKSDDPATLNDVAYSLADAKVNLDQAREWAENAVTELEDQSQNAKSSGEAELRITYQLSLTWDTLGWVYFQQGDLKRAEEYVRAAWQLGEESIVGEHLGDIYEKEGKKELAARAYEYALTVIGAGAASAFNMSEPTQTAKAQNQQFSEINRRYEKLTGKKPELMIRRLPSGEWTKTPAEQLRLSRQVKLNNETKLFGSANFKVVFKPGKVDRAEFESGDGDLDVLTTKLKAAHYPIVFPSESDAILLMHVSVSCHATEPCVASLINPLPPSRPTATMPVQ